MAPLTFRPGAGAAPLAISVIVPTYDGERRLPVLLDHLAAQDVEPTSFEVIVVDDGSKDGTAAMLAADTRPFRLHVISRANAGRAAACNAGAAAAVAAVLLFLDDDMEPQPNCLRAHIRGHLGSTPLARMGAVPVAGPTTPAARFVAARFERHMRTLAEAGAPSGPREFYSGHLSLPGSLFDQAGGFDSTFRAYGNEDVDLYLRLRSLGAPILFAADAVAVQRYDKDGRALISDAASKGRTCVQLAAKHPEAAADTRLATWSDATPRRIALRRAGLDLIDHAPWLLLPAAPVLATLERRSAPRLDSLYDLSIDVAFWHGVRVALRAEGAGRPDLPLISRRAAAGAAL